MRTSRKSWTSILLSLLLSFFAAAASGADDAKTPIVAILPPVLPSAHVKHVAAATAVVDTIQASLTPDARLRFVERTEILRVVKERETTLALDAASSLDWRGALGADLLVQPRFGLPVKDGWPVRLVLIDPQRADVLGAITGTVPGDAATGPRAELPEELGLGLAKWLLKEFEHLKEMRQWTPVGVLFFSNTTRSNDRLDRFSSTLAAAIDAAERPGLRMLRFPAVEASRGEQELALAGITARDERWREVAKWWVWGEFHEVDWEGKPFEEAGVEVNATVWDGEHEPVTITERGKAVARADLAKQVANRVASTIAEGKLPEKALPADQLAARLLQQANALTTENIGGEWGAVPAWLSRWRQSCRLLELARFISPGDRNVSLEWLRARFRGDMAKTAGTSSGTQYYDDPQHIFFIRQAHEWGRFVDRFGLDGEWPQMWPQRPNIDDNRTRIHSVAGMYIHSVGELLQAFPGSGYGGYRSWPLDQKAVATLRDAWTEETVRRVKMIAEAKGRMTPSVVNQILELKQGLYHSPAAWKRILEHLVMNTDAAQLGPVGPSVATAVQELERSTKDTAWAAPLLARLPAPRDPAAFVLTGPPMETPESLKPATQSTFDGIALGERYSVQVAAIATWGEAWLASAHGQELVGDFAMKNLLFMHVPKDGPGKIRRIEKALKLEDGVVAVAQDGPIVWMAGGGNGIAQIDLSNTDWKRWSLKSGLPVEVFGDIDVDLSHAAVAVSGRDVSPPVLVIRENDKWIPRTVETFHGSERLLPFGERVAATRDSVLVAGDCYGVSPFVSLWRRKTQQWVNVREPLLAHLEEQRLDVRGVQFGKDRFGIIDAVALPSGGFVLIHELGATWINDAGDPQRTTPWGEGRLLANVGQAVRSRDASRLWIVSNIAGASGGGPRVIELPLQPGVAPKLRDIPGSASQTLCVAEGEHRLLIGRERWQGLNVVFLPLPEVNR